MLAAISALNPAFCMPNNIDATVAQLVEQGIRNAQVCGSTPHGGSKKKNGGFPVRIAGTLLLFQCCCNAPNCGECERLYVTSIISINQLKQLASK